MKLNELSPAKGSRKNRKRRGTKGHNSRSGGGVRPGFEGGQMPIHRRLPKRGFTNIFADRVATINIRDLKKFESGSVVDEAALVGSGLVKGVRDGIKLLGHGEIDFPLSVKINKISESARKKIEAAGGSVEVV